MSIEITEKHFKQLVKGKMIELVFPNGKINFQDPRVLEIYLAANELVDFIKEHKIKFI